MRINSEYEGQRWHSEQPRPGPAVAPPRRPLDSFLSNAIASGGVPAGGALSLAGEVVHSEGGQTEFRYLAPLTIGQAANFPMSGKTG